jgi:hypothetical protein
MSYADVYNNLSYMKLIGQFVQLVGAQVELVRLNTD